MIITDESLLRRDCEPVLLEEVDKLRSELEKGLEYSASIGRPGIGLSCPQIGILKKMAIVRIANPLGRSYNVDLVNPEILEFHKKILFKGEGCLSFPDLYVDVPRYEEIVVKTDIFPHKFVATGLLSVCIQHEIDHLNGILLTDNHES